MAKQSGLGDRLAVAGYDLSGDIGSLSRIGGGPTPIPLTGIDREAHERTGGLRDGAIGFTAYFNPSAGRAHPRLASLPGADQIVTYGRGAVAGRAAASMVAKQINYDGSRGADGAFTLDTEALGSGFGLEWGTLLTAWPRADTGATNGASVDLGAAGTFGLQAYLQVFGFTGTDVTIKLQQSSDNGGADAWADVTSGAFTAVTAGPTSQRIATSAAQAVERYLRVVTVTTSGFTALSFVVSVCVNATTPTF